jgi:HlyD family secretion protein
MEMLKADPQSPAAPEPPKEAPKEPAPASSRVPSIIVALVVAAVASLSIFYLLRGEPFLVQGEADATRLDIAARVDGRRDSRRARPRVGANRSAASNPLMLPMLK